MTADPRKPRRPPFKSGGRSLDFTPAPQGHRRYLLDRIPTAFWLDVQAKAKRERTSSAGADSAPAARLAAA